MSWIKRPAVVIPLFLNLLFVAVIPFYLGFPERFSIGPMLLAAFAFPWLLAFVVVSIIRQVGNNTKRKREEKEHSDFV
ncbi:MAG: hypothetical protein GY752_00560 [bacterium]|nr:hypothetical protein [bacterium]MCP4800441.1 hypothetical protein [bacterium]